MGQETEGVEGRSPRGENEPGKPGGRNPEPPGRPVLVLGATGLVGGHLVETLAAEGRGPVHLLLRRDPPPALQQPGVRWTVAPSDRWTEAPVWEGVTTVFVALGTTRRAAGSAAAFRAVDLDLVVDCARRAEAAGVHQLQVVSSMGADPDSRFLYPRTKGEMEREVSFLDIPSIILLRPSLLLGEREEQRTGERVAAALLQPMSPLLRGPLRALRPIPATAVARAMVRMERRADPGIAVLEPGVIRRIGQSGGN